MDNNKKQQLWRTIVMGIFLSVPIVSSFISAIHLVTLFGLGNEPWISYTLAIAFELGAIASFLALQLIPSNSNKWMVWTIFFMLAFMQIFGNVFYTYDYIFNTLITKPTWLNSFNDFMGYFTGNDNKSNQMILSWLIGLPIPIVALFFLKAAPEYWTKQNINTNIIDETEIDTTSKYIQEESIDTNDKSITENIVKIEDDVINDTEITSTIDTKNDDKYMTTIGINANPAVYQNNIPK